MQVFFSCLCRWCAFCLAALVLALWIAADASCVGCCSFFNFSFFLFCILFGYMSKYVKGLLDKNGFGVLDNLDQELDY